jgi:AraC-like DNA-binding protein
MPRPHTLEETRPSGHGRARGLVSSRTSGRRIESRTYAPPSALADLVECFWIGRWDLPADAPHVTELLGDPAMHVCFEAGASRIVGVWTRLWRRELAGRGQVRAAKLRVGAARHLLPLPAWRYTNRILPIDDVLPGAAALERDVLAPATDDEAFGTLARWLETQRRDVEAPDDVALAVAAARAIAEDPSLARVEALAKQLRVHVRELQRVFRAHVGATPKHVIRRTRLQEVALRLERGDAVSLSRLAAELGYADHAHLARDFKSATGKSPSAFGRDVWR